MTIGEAGGDLGLCRRSLLPSPSGNAPAVRLTAHQGGACQETRQLHLLAPDAQLLPARARRRIAQTAALAFTKTSELNGQKIDSVGA